MPTPRRRRWPRTRLRSESGQALIEFAFVLIMMIMLILGLVDFARVFLQFQVVTDAAREGARQAVLSGGPAPDSIASVVRTALAVGGVDVTGISTVASCAHPTGSVTNATVYSCRWDSGTSGDEVRVGIAVPFEFSLIGPFIGWATGQQNITLRSSISMRNE